MANEQNNKGELFIYLVAIILVLSIIVSISNIAKITGQAIDKEGTANLTILTITSINFTTNIIDWGSGAVDLDQTSATLNTAAGAANITNGNWTANTDGFVVENDGNTNVTIELATGKTAQQFVGGSSPDYEYNVTSVEADSCTNSTGGTEISSGYDLGTFVDVNTTSPGTIVCDDFTFNNSRDEFRIDLKLVIPIDATETGTAIGDIITATATAL